MVSVIVVFHCISGQRLISVGDMDTKRNSPMAPTILLRLVPKISILIKIYQCTFEYTIYICNSSEYTDNKVVIAMGISSHQATDNAVAQTWESVRV